MFRCNSKLTFVFKYRLGLINDGIQNGITLDEQIQIDRTNTGTGDHSKDKTIGVGVIEPIRTSVNGETIQLREQTVGGSDGRVEFIGQGASQDQGTTTIEPNHGGTVQNGFAPDQRVDGSGVDQNTGGQIGGVAVTGEDVQNMDGINVWPSLSMGMSTTPRTEFIYNLDDSLVPIVGHAAIRYNYT